MTSDRDRQISQSKPITRRHFVQTTAGAAVGLGTSSLLGADSDKPAVLGGTPIREGTWPTWPIVGQSDEQAVAEVVRSGDWFRYRGGESTVDRFESKWAREVGTKYCQATNSGTAAMITSLASLGIGPGR